jgi:hypothetical protein
MTAVERNLKGGDGESGADLQATVLATCPIAKKLFNLGKIQPEALAEIGRGIAQGLDPLEIITTAIETRDEESDLFPRTGEFRKPETITVPLTELQIKETVDFLLAGRRQSMGRPAFIAPSLLAETAKSSPAIEKAIATMRSAIVRLSMGMKILKATDSKALRERAITELIVDQMREARERIDKILDEIFTASTDFADEQEEDIAVTNGKLEGKLEVEDYMPERSAGFAKEGVLELRGAIKPEMYNREIVGVLKSLRRNLIETARIIHEKEFPLKSGEGEKPQFRNYFDEPGNATIIEQASEDTRNILNRLVEVTDLEHGPIFLSESELSLATKFELRGILDDMGMGLAEYVRPRRKVGKKQHSEMTGYRLEWGKMEYPKPRATARPNAQAEEGRLADLDEAFRRAGSCHGALKAPASRPAPAHVQETEQPERPSSRTAAPATLQDLYVPRGASSFRIAYEGGGKKRGQVVATPDKE